MSKKQTYRIRNWSDYNASLVQKGRVTFWFSDDCIDKWHEVKQTNGPGRPPLYSDTAITCALTIRAIFNLTLRATEGFVSSLITLMDLGLSTPDYTTLCKRQKELEIELTTGNQNKTGPLDIVVDSTGLKLFGEGEWKVRQHGAGYRRRWRKLHLAVNPQTQLIETAVLSTNDYHDSQILPDLLDSLSGQPLGDICCDGAYDTHAIYESIQALGANPLIPPRKDAVIKQHGNCKAKPKARDEVIRAIRKQGRKGWKADTGYHKRSLSETAMYRLKTIFGGQLRSRVFESQCVESFIRCSILNKMFLLCKPDSYLVT